MNYEDRIMAERLTREGFVQPKGLVGELRDAFIKELPPDCQRPGPTPLALRPSESGRALLFYPDQYEVWFKSPIEDLTIEQIARALEDFRNERTDVTYCAWNSLRCLLKRPEKIFALVALRSLK